MTLNKHEYLEVHTHTHYYAEKSTFLQYFLKKFIFFLTRNIRIWLFLMESYAMKMDIIRYYVSPKSTPLNLWIPNYDYLTVQK